MTYKKLVEMIANIKTEEEYNEACYQVDRSFDTAEKISWNDHEIMIKLLGVVYLANKGFKEG